MRSQCLARCETQAELMLVLLLNLADLMQFLLVFLLLLAVCVNDVDCLVEVVFNLPHFSRDHFFDFGVIVCYAFSGPVVDLAHDFVEYLSFKLFFEVLVNCAQPRQTLHIFADQTLSITPKPFFKVGFSLLSRVLDLFDACQRSVPHRLLVLELARVVEELFQGAVKLDRLLNVGVVEHLLAESLVADENCFRTVFGASHCVRPVFQLRARGLHGTLLETKDLSGAQDREFDSHARAVSDHFGLLSQLELRHWVDVHLFDELLGLRLDLAWSRQLEGPFLDEVDAIWLIALLENNFAAVEFDQLDVVEQVFQLCLAHGRQDSERF